MRGEKEKMLAGELHKVSPESIR